MAYLRWSLLDEALRRGQDLLGHVGPGRREAPRGQLVAGGGHDETRLGGRLGEEAGGVRGGRGLRGLARGLATEAHLAELRGQVIPLGGRRAQALLWGSRGGLGWCRCQQCVAAVLFLEDPALIVLD